MSKSLHVRNYHDATVKSFMDITGALGLSSPEELNPSHVFHRPEHGPAETYEKMHPAVASGDFLGDRIPEAYKNYWQRASAEAF